MKFLAIDTSGKALTVIAYNGTRAETAFRTDCALRHSELLTDEIDGALSRAGMTAGDCDFFAAVVGPGSFTGIRIGIATVKGLCTATGKPALAITSFDVIAYAEKSEPVLALVDAGHGFLYTCGYDGEKRVTDSPRYRSREDAEPLGASYRFASAESVPVECERTDAAEGLLRAVFAKAEQKGEAENLTALYIRKSSAEENRK